MSLTSLPTELIATICQHLDLESFRAFRLTCHHLNEKSRHTFRGRFYEKHTLNWSIDSLQTLLAMTEDQYFGTATTHLIIDATPIYALQLWLLRTNTCYLHQEPLCAICYPGPDPDTVIDQTRRRFEDEEQTTASHWSDTQEDLKILQSVFRHNRINTIEFSYSGMAATHGDRNPKQYCLSSQIEMSRPFVVAMTAIATTGITSITAITILPTHNFGAVSVGRLEAVSRYLPQLAAPLQNLTTLHLKLRDWREPSGGFELSPTHVPFIVRLLSLCTNLQSLSLELYSALEHTTLLHDLAIHCHFTELREVELSLLQIYNVFDLLVFLKSANATLRRLKLRNIVLHDEQWNADAWWEDEAAHELQWVGMLEKEYCDLEGLLDGDNGAEMVGWWKAVVGYPFKAD